MICERCGSDSETWPMGAWPFCRGNPADHVPARGGVIRDEIPGGFVQENFGHEPETFYSWSAMRKRADALGLQPFVKQLETIRERDYIDAYTLESKRILVTRGSTPKAENPGRLDTLETSVKPWKFDGPDSRA